MPRLHGKQILYINYSGLPGAATRELTYRVTVPYNPIAVRVCSD